MYHFSNVSPWLSCPIHVLYPHHHELLVSYLSTACRRQFLSRVCESAAQRRPRRRLGQCRAGMGRGSALPNRHHLSDRRRPHHFPLSISIIIHVRVIISIVDIIIHVRIHCFVFIIPVSGLSSSRSSTSVVSGLSSFYERPSISQSYIRLW